jgi:hypothetical protein
MADEGLSFPRLRRIRRGGAAFAVLHYQKLGFLCAECHSTDCFYLALTEEFAKSGPAEFLTFDKRVVNVAASNAPSVKANLLPS